MGPLKSDSTEGGKMVAPGCASKAGRVSGWGARRSQAMEESLPSYHEDHIAGDGRTIHCNIRIWYTNLFLCRKPRRNPQQKQQWIKNGRNLKRFRSRTWQKSEVNQRWSMKQGRRAQKFILPHWWTPVMNAELETKHKKIQRSSCTISWTRISCIPNDGSKSPGYHLQTARVRWTSSRRSICLYPTRNGRCSQIIPKKSKIGMSRHLDSSTTTQMA